MELLNYTTEKAIECVSLLTNDICEYPTRLYSGFDVALILSAFLIIFLIIFGIGLYNYNKRTRG